MSKGVIPIERALVMSGRAVEVLGPACERIEVAGSIRRLKRVVGDLELVAIPRVQRNLLGERTGSQLDALLEQLQAEGRLRRIKGGDRYKQFHVIRGNVTLDLFIVEPETWGVQFLLRTGPAEFSRRMVTKRSQGGYMPDELHVYEGRIWPEFGAALETPEEADVFTAYGMDFVTPENRR